jgi:hypothetical protein
MYVIHGQGGIMKIKAITTLLEDVLDTIQEAKQRSYTQTHEEVLRELEKRGWKTNKSLKFPWAESPKRDGGYIYFKKQAVYGCPEKSINSGWSITPGAYRTADIVKLTDFLIQQLARKVDMAEKFKTGNY